MTNKYEVTPNPSQPNKSLIILGLKTNENIDAINLKTRLIKRLKKLHSLYMKF